MSGGRRYVLDANVFIEAHQRYYAPDICPGFWLALLCQHKQRRVFSIDKVKAELLAAKDRLSRWVTEKPPKTFFKGTADKNVVDAFRDMMNWVESEPQFSAEAKSRFASAADGWLIAYAKVNGLVVVTHEEYAPEAKKKVPIPNLCIKFSVDYCNTFEMLRDLKTAFFLRTRRGAT